MKFKFYKFFFCSFHFRSQFMKSMLLSTLTSQCADAIASMDLKNIDDLTFNTPTSNTNTNAINLCVNSDLRKMGVEKESTCQKSSTSSNYSFLRQSKSLKGSQKTLNYAIRQSHTGDAEPTTTQAEPSQTDNG